MCMSVCVWKGLGCKIKEALLAAPINCIYLDNALWIIVLDCQYACVSFAMTACI